MIERQERKSQQTTNMTRKQQTCVRSVLNKNIKTLQQIVAKIYQSRTPPHWSVMDNEIVIIRGRTTPKNLKNGENFVKLPTINFVIREIRALNKTETWVKS